jgi:hypothetical protein
MRWRRSLLAITTGACAGVRRRRVPESGGATGRPDTGIAHLSRTGQSVGVDGREAEIQAEGSEMQEGFCQASRQVRQDESQEASEAGEEV